MPNWRELLSDTRPPDVNRVLEDLSASDLDELILVATGGEGAERELAFGLLCVLRYRHDDRFLGRPLKAFNDLWLQANGHARERPPESVREELLVSDAIGTEVELRVPVVDGEGRVTGQLALGPGRMKCSVRVWVEANPDAVHDSSDYVHLEARLTDNRGNNYVASRRWHVDRLVMPIVAGGKWAAPERNVEPFAYGLRCFADHRERYLGLSRVAGAHAFAYYAKYLYLMMDLQVARGVDPPNGDRGPDTLIAKIHPSIMGGIQGLPTPGVRVGIPLLSRMVLCPGLVRSDYPGESVPLRQDGSGEPPQENVRFVRASSETRPALR